MNMRCRFCNEEFPDDARYCPKCGHAAQPDAAAPEQAAAWINPEARQGGQQFYQPGSENVFQRSNFDKISSLLNDRLFLVICILLSAAAVFELFAGKFGVITILITIFAWILYANVKSNKLGETKQLRNISGTVFADYVVNWVLAGLVAFLGIIFLVGAIVGSSSAFYGIMDEIVESLPNSSSLSFDIYDLTHGAISVVLVIMAVCLFLCAAVIAVINQFGISRIHKMLQSSYKGLNNDGQPLEHVNGASIWLFVFGGICILGALSTLGSISSGLNASKYLMSFIYQASAAVMYIMLGVLIRKHMLDK